MHCGTVISDITHPWRIMFYSEEFFPHLRAAKEEALNRDAERIRIQRERAVPGPTLGARLMGSLADVASGLRSRLVQEACRREPDCVGCPA